MNPNLFLNDHAKSKSAQDQRKTDVMKVKEFIHGIFFPDLNALPCYRIESEMKKADPNADLRAPVVVDPSSPVPAEDWLDHRLGWPP